MCGTCGRKRQARRRRRARTRARLGAAQADLTETKAKQLRGELVEASEVVELLALEAKGVPQLGCAHPTSGRIPIGAADADLDEELRACLDELADDKGA